MAAVLTESCW